MQILLANAKIMNDHSEVGPLTMPKFQAVANELAADMALCDIDTLAKELDCSRALAAENWRRYQNFHVAEKLPAIMAYNGHALAEERKWVEVADGIDISETVYQGLDWEKPRRIVMVRQHIDIRPKAAGKRIQQLDLFPEFSDLSNYRYSHTRLSQKVKRQESSIFSKVYDHEESIQRHMEHYG